MCPMFSDKQCLGNVLGKHISKCLFAFFKEENQADCLQDVPTLMSWQLLRFEHRIPRINTEKLPSERWENCWNSLAFSEHLSIKNRGVAPHFSSAPVATQHLYAMVCLVVVWIRLRLPSTQINLAGKLFFSLMIFRDFPNKTSIYRGFSC